MSIQAMHAARDILKTLRRTYSDAPRTRVLADEKSFSHLDLAGYDRFRRDLEAKGYRLLGNYEVVDFNRASSLRRTFLRVMVSADGTVACAYCQMTAHMVKRLWRLFNDLMDGGGKPAWDSFTKDIAIHHEIAVSTDFEDGRSVCACIGESAGQFANPPGIEVHYFPEGTPLDTLLQTLGERVSWLRTEHPDTQPVTVSTLEQLFQLQDRAMTQKVAYRKSVGWITRDELLAMSNGNETFADEVYAEIQNQLARETEAERR
jgi:hypothetical protein